MLANSLRRFGVLMEWNLASLKSRSRSVAVMIVGFAGVVAVFVAVLSSSAASSMHPVPSAPPMWRWSCVAPP